MYFLSIYIYKFIYRAKEYYRGLFLWLSIVACGGVCKSIPRVGKGLTFKYPPHRGIEIGANCFIGPSCIFDVPNGAKLIIGNNVTFTAGAVIASANSIKIGNDCLFAEWVSIRDSQHIFLAGTSINRQGLYKAAIEIGNDVWIGKSTLVLCGSVLNSGCIVGANSFVKNRFLDENGIYIGVPAKKIGVRKSILDPVCTIEKY